MPALLWLRLPGSVVVGALTVAARHRRRDGQRLHLPRAVAAGVEHAATRSLQFNLTAAMLGPLFAAAVGAGDPAGSAIAAATMAGAQSCCSRCASSGCIASDSLELQGHRAAAVHRARRRLVLRGVLLASARSRCRCSPPAAPIDRVTLAHGAWRCSSRSPREILGRYLFFVSVVPKHLAAPYIASASEAA